MISEISSPEALIMGLSVSIFTVIISISLAAVTTYCVLLKRCKKRRQMRYEKMLREERLMYCSQISALTEQLRRVRHDHQNFVISMGALLQKKDYERACTYLDMSGKAILGDAQYHGMYTGSSIISAMLECKNSVAEKIGIKLDFIGALPQGTFPEKDVSCIICTLIDNAIGCCKSLKSNKKKTVIISSAGTAGLLILSVKSPFSPLPSGDDRVFKKLAKDCRARLKPIMSVIDSYGGNVNIYQSKNHMVTEIKMSLCKKCDEY